MEDNWALAASAYANGRRAASLWHIRRAQGAHRAGGLASVALCANEQALNGGGAAPRARVPGDAPVPARVFAMEVAATAAYNRALGKMARGDVGAARAICDVGVKAVCAHVAWVWAVLCEGAGEVGQDWGGVRGVMEVVRAEGAQMITGEGVAVVVGRFAEAGAALFELLAAVEVSQGRSSRAMDAANVAVSFRGAMCSLANVSDAVVPNQSGEHYGTEQNDDDDEANLDDAMDLDMGSADGMGDRDANGGANGSDRETVMQSDPVHDRDAEAARPSYLTALAHARCGEWDSALSCVVERAREAVPNSASIEEERKHGRMPKGLVFSEDDLECHWPSVYLAGALMLCRGSVADSADATHMLDACAAHGYRSADALALIARFEQGENSLFAWQRALAIDYVRPGGLWAAATVFGEVGQYEQCASLLACLEELLLEKGGCADESDNEPVRKRARCAAMGSADQNLPKDSPTGTEPFVGQNCTTIVLPSGGLQADTLSVFKVRAERGRALAGAECWDDALAILDEAVKQSAPVTTASCTSAHSMLLRDRAWALTCSGALEQALVACKTAVDAAGNNLLLQAAAQLAAAEAHLRLDNVSESQRLLNSAFQNASLTQTSSDTSTTRLLRGILYNNLAVLAALLSPTDLPTAERNLAAAQAALDKSTMLPSEGGTAAYGYVAESHAHSATLNRTLILHRLHRPHDAATHWLARRARSRGVGRAAVPNVDENTAQKMDEAAQSVCKAHEVQQRAEKLLDEVRREWPTKE